MKPKEALIHFEEHLCKHCCEWNKSLRHCNTCPTDAAKKALEKQIPMVPDYEGDGYADGELVYDTWICPNCGKYYEVDYDNYKYCPECGQAIDQAMNWSDEDEY